MNPLRFLISVLLALPFEAEARVRKVEVTPDQIVTVKTAIGIATLIQVPERPNSIVVGDLAGFKVEYLDQAITIKPLIRNAKSNLYIYTDYRRFNVELMTGPEASADYVVYLLPTKEKAFRSSIKWMASSAMIKNGGLEIRILRIGVSRDDLIHVEFEIESDVLEKIKPESFWVTQSGKVRPIQNLVLSAVEVSKSKSIRGIIQIRKADCSVNTPLQLEIRRKSTSTLILGKPSQWK